ncbi:MAG TPA: nitrilase-related carbon-nitrogen hydrolase, partial [Candidatus Melainabacteria bacterium]|nr:nitrilase-related carbon-nitrogen hydrolase [Candidatus Melainabacteria bacterium]
ELATARHRDPNTPPVPLAVLQGNVSIAEERLKITKPEQIKELYKSLGQNLGALILCLPEGVINSNQMVPGGLLSVLENISKSQNKEVIAGSIETLQTGHANAARLLSPESIKPTKQASSLYLKNRLVPLGESAPIDILNKRIPAPVRERIPASRESFIKASSTNLLKSIWGDVGLSIYIELFYPRLIADEVRKGANLLVNVSNLSWFHESSLKQQLIAAGVFRAVENGRFLVISTNTGVSAIIAPSGMISNISLSGHRGVLLNTIQFLYRKTPFSRMWWM